MIQMHFTTLKVETIREHHEEIFDFLCKFLSVDTISKLDLNKSNYPLAAKIGGWMGLVIGASLISLAELFYFALQLIKLCCSRNKTR